MTASFRPPLGLRNSHIQTIFSSVGPRRAHVRREFAKYRDGQQAMLLDCHDGIRLSGYHNRSSSQNAQHCVIIIHGWEGSADSSYVLSMSSKLLSLGIDVFRLNLRDHGDSQHLNKGIFNSTLIDEVISGIEDMQAKLNYDRYSLVGFSLGGNFSLRVAALAHDKAIKLSRVIAFCPAIHAAASNRVLNERKNFVYGQYFVRKWKRSLLKKLEYFPEYGYAEDLKKMKTLDEMNEQLIPKYTAFSDVEEYFDAYALTNNTMASTICPCYLHFAKDDMIIPYEDIGLLADNPDLHITLTERGGHCGYILNWKFESWQDQRVLELLSIEQ